MYEQRISKNSGDQTDLRSEKVRNIIGDVPSILTRLGISIIFLVAIFVLAGSYFVPYKTYYSKSVLLYSEPSPEMIRASGIGTVILPKGVRDGQVQSGNLIAIFVNIQNKRDSLKAKLNGQLVLNCYTQQRVTNGQLLAAVIPNEIKEIKARLDVPEKLMHHLVVGKTVTLTPTDNEKSINGKIAFIYPLPILKNGNDIRSAVLAFDYPLKSASGDTISYHPLLKGEVRISTGDSKLFNIIFHFNN